MDLVLHDLGSMNEWARNEQEWKTLCKKHRLTEVPCRQDGYNCGFRAVEALLRKEWDPKQYRQKVADLLRDEAFKIHSRALWPTLFPAKAKTHERKLGDFKKEDLMNARREMARKVLKRQWMLNTHLHILLKHLELRVAVRMSNYEMAIFGGDGDVGEAVKYSDARLESLVRRHGVIINRDDVHWAYLRPTEAGEKVYEDPSKRRSKRLRGDDDVV